MNLSTFLGHFHPIMVHLPIGFMVLALVIQVLSKRPGFENVSIVNRFIVLLTALSAGMACLLGWLLSISGDYDYHVLSRHQWGGIAFALLSLFLWLVYPLLDGKKLLGSLLFANIAMIYIGHQGGSLTHGEDYLSVQKLFEKPVAMPTDIKEVDLYTHVVQPIFENNCYQCHRSGKKKGDLVMTSLKELIQGGKNGSSIVEGQAVKSELYRRITLDPSHKEFMPTDGKTPLSLEEVEAIEIWINSGAKEGKKVSTLNLNTNQENVIARLAGLKSINEKGTSQEDEYIQITGTLTAEQIEKLRAEGFGVRVMLNKPTILDVSTLEFQKLDRQVVLKKLSLLNEVATHILWLNLSKLDLKNDDLKLFKGLKNLEKLNLSSNSELSDVADFIQNMEYLKTLNLYETNISKVTLPKILKNHQNLKLYLGKTNIMVSDTIGIQNEIVL